MVMSTRASNKVTNQKKHSKKQTMPKKGSKPKFPKNNSRAAKQRKKGGLIISLCIAGLIILIFVLITISNNRPITLKDLKTSYSSMTLKISYNDNCANKVDYKIDFKTHDTFGVMDNATSEEYNCKRYFLGSNGKTYQKIYAADWKTYEFKKDYPDSRVKKVLEAIKNSQGELLTDDGDIAVFGITDLNDPKMVYAEVNNLSAFGNEWGASNYQSLSAKVYLQKSGVINKIIFYPVSKSQETSWAVYATNTRIMYLPTTGVLEKTSADFDSIRKCKEVIWSFSDINSSAVNYKEDLWNLSE